MEQLALTFGWEGKDTKGNAMKIGTAIALGIAAAVVVGAAVYMIDVDQTHEAALPEVTVEGGQMPEFDADVGSVDVGETTVTAPVPEVDVTVNDQEFNLPTIEVSPPEENVAENN